MLNGFGRGMGRGFRRGMGFGFRGTSPPWPYVGRGRGGLPRCGYFLSGGAGAQAAWQYQPPAYPFYTPAASEVIPKQELDFLKDQAEAIKGQLNKIETRIRELASEKE